VALFVHDVDSQALDPERRKGPEVEIWESLGNCGLQGVALYIFCLVGTLLLDLVIAITE
jgi:hypothetical protein